MADQQPFSQLILHKAHHLFSQLLALDNHGLCTHSNVCCRPHVPFAELRSREPKHLYLSGGLFSINHLKYTISFQTVLFICSLLNHMEGPKHQSWFPALSAFLNQDFICTHRFPLLQLQKTMPTATSLLYHYTTISQ